MTRKGLKIISAIVFTSFGLFIVATSVFAALDQRVCTNWAPNDACDLNRLYTPDDPTDAFISGRVYWDVTSLGAYTPMPNPPAGGWTTPAPAMSPSCCLDSPDDGNWQAYQWIISGCTSFDENGDGSPEGQRCDYTDMVEDVTIAGCPAEGESDYINAGQRHTITASGGSGVYEATLDNRWGEGGWSGNIVPVTGSANQFEYIPNEIQNAGTETIIVRDDHLNSNSAQCSLRLIRRPNLSFNNTGCPETLRVGDTWTFDDTKLATGDLDEEIVYSAGIQHAAMNSYEYTALTPGWANITVRYALEPNGSNGDSCSFEVVDPVRITNCEEASGAGLAYADHPAFTFAAEGGTRTRAPFYEWSNTGNPAGTPQIVATATGGYMNLLTQGHFKIQAADSGDPTNSTECEFDVGPRPIEITDVPANFVIHGEGHQFNHTGGPYTDGHMAWSVTCEGSDDCGTINAGTGMYIPSNDSNIQSVTVTVREEGEGFFPANAASDTIAYAPPECPTGERFRISNRENSQVLTPNGNRGEVTVYPGEEYVFQIISAGRPQAQEHPEIRLIAQNFDDNPLGPHVRLRISRTAEGFVPLDVVDTEVPEGPGGMCLRSIRLNIEGPVVQRNSPAVIHL